MMGPSHAMSGVAVWLGGVAVYSHVTSTTPSVPLIVMGSIVAGGAALGPDFDSYSSTVVRSFGIFGRMFYYLVNTISLFFYGITRTRYDKDKTEGHRTFFHTTVMALLAGGLTALATFSTGEVKIWEQTYTWGQFFALVIMGVFLNLAFSGLFEGFRKLRKTYGPYIMMAASIGITFLLAYLLPDLGTSYAWLGIAVTVGWFVHLLGDLITKMGVPLVWPLKIIGKRWYDVSLPSFMRIEAGGTVEKVALVPLFIITIILAGAYDAMLVLEVAPW